MGFFSDLGNSTTRRATFNGPDGAQTLHRLAISGAILKRAPAADSRTITVIASDGTKDSAGDIVDPYKIELDRYKKNPVVLFQHDQNRPVAMCTDIGVKGGQLIATIQFPEPGTSSASDEARQLVKSGVVSGCSIGFRPLERPEPIGDGSGVAFGRIELVEVSLVSVPANPSALVVQRSAQELQAPSAAHWAAAKRAELEDQAMRRHYDNPHKPRVRFRPAPIVQRDWSSLPVRAKATPTAKASAASTRKDSVTLPRDHFGAIAKCLSRFSDMRRLTTKLHEEMGEVVGQHHYDMCAALESMRRAGASMKPHVDALRAGATDDGDDDGKSASTRPTYYKSADSPLVALDADQERSRLRRLARVVKAKAAI